MSQDDKKTIGRILLEQQALSPAQLDEALSRHVPGSVPLASRLTEQGLISELDALKALSTQRGVPGIDLNQVVIKLSDLDVVPREVAMRHKLFPVLDREDRIFCAMANPEDRKALEELEFVTGKRVFAYIALEVVLMRVLREAYDLKERGEAFYVGPSCPAEVLERSGIVRAAPAPAPAEHPAFTTPSAEPARSGVRPPPPPPPPPPRGRGGPARAVPLPIPNAPAARVGAAGSSAAPSMEASSAASSTAASSTAASSTAASPTAASPTGGRPPLPRERERERRFRPSAAGMLAQGNQIIVDDTMQKVVDSEVSEADFGDLGREISVVADLPKSEPPKKIDAKKILVVDDEAEIRKMLRLVLEEQGYQVIEADRGKLALQLVKLESPDLIILDAMLPEIHGFDIARRIRGSSRYGHMPIVMISAVYRGWRIAEDVKTSYGVDSYIEKPFRVADVVAAVQAALKMKRERVDPDKISAEAERLLNEGVAAYKQGDLDKATELLEAGTRIDPLAYRLRFHLGLLYGKRGQVYDAIQELERALEIQSKHFASVKNLAILYQQAGFRNKAVEAWERALGAAPDDDTKKAIREHLLTLL